MATPISQIVQKVHIPEPKTVELTTGFCDTCKKDVYAPYVNIKKQEEDFIFHPGCFVCHQCLEPFGDGEYYETDNRMLCEFDFLLLHGYVIACFILEKVEMCKVWRDYHWKVCDGAGGKVAWRPFQLWALR